MGDIDPVFVQSPDHRPTAETADADAVAGEIPVVDLSGETVEVVAAIGKACEEWGFFQVINHGVAEETRKKLEISAKEFFALEMEEKRKVKRDERNSKGYHDGENTKNVRDWKEVFDYLVEDEAEIPASTEPEDQELTTLTNQWPQYPTHFR